MRIFIVCLTLPLAATAAVHHIDCAGAKWRSLDSVNALELQPGDQLLLKSGCRWTGTLSPKGSGTEGRPIVLDRYGEGAPPRIDGAGAEAALLLRNQEFWEIANLEVTNDAPEPGLRRGVLIKAENLGRALRHVHLRGLDVHHVKGKLGADIVSKCTGGIAFEVVTKEKPTRLDDILIENNRIRSVDNTGIYLYTDSSPHPRDPQWEQLHHTRVVIRGNHLEDIGKNAMGIRASLEPLIERNVIRNAAARYHGNAVYVFGSKGAVMQYNEVSGTQFLGLEGAAFDSDYNSEGTLIQYNYSHENGGGLVNLCNNPASKAPRGYNDGTIVRYNLSRNETDRVIGFDGPVTNTRIYRNSLQIGPGRKPRIVVFDLFGKSPGYADHTWFRDNVIIDEGDGTYDWGKATNFFFEGNCFGGRHPANEPEDPKKRTSGCEAGGNPIFDFVEGHVFASPRGIDLKTDLYLPKGAGPFPAVVYLHGGGWSGGDRKQLRRQAAHLASLGIAGMAIEYRLSGQAPYPAALEDSRTAVRWLRANAGKYRIDPRRIAAAGSSAGGHLAALLGVTQTEARGDASDIAAVVAFNPVLDLADMPPRGTNVEEFLGGKCEERVALCREASPISHVRPGLVPFLILHGTGDQTVPYRQASAMADRLKAAGVKVELFTAPDAPHTFWGLKQWYEPTLMAMETFLRQCF